MRQSTTRAGQSVQAHRATHRKDGPTTLFLNEVATVPASRCEEMFREIVSRKDSHNAIELEAVFRRWMELEEPKELLARLEAEKDSQSFWAGPFFEAWASISYAAAVAGTENDGSFAHIRGLAAVRRHDPAFLTGPLEIWDFDNSVVVNALAMLGRDNPDLAREVATHKGSKPDNNADLIAAVARGWAARDPGAALEWLKSLELSASNRTKALNELFSEWIKSDLAGASEAIEKHGLDTKPTRSGDGPRQNEPLGFLRSPENAASGIFLGIHLDPMLNLADLYQQFANSQVDWEKHQFMMPPIDQDGWFPTDPAKAAEDATRLPPGKARDFLMSYICGQWADRNPEEATAYARSHGLRDPIVRDEPSAESVRAALSSPDETFATLFTPQEAGPPKPLTNLAMKWAAIEPRAAAEWLISQPESVTYDHRSNPHAQNILHNALGYYWARVDAVGASNWVEDLPDGPRKTQAWHAMNDYVGEYCPDLAFAISADILHGETRAGTLAVNLKKVAHKVGTPAAGELVRTTDLAPQERAALLQVLDNLPPKP